MEMLCGLCDAVSRETVILLFPNTILRKKNYSHRKDVSTCCSHCLAAVVQEIWRYCRLFKQYESTACCSSNVQVLPAVQAMWQYCRLFKECDGTVGCSSNMKVLLVVQATWRYCRLFKQCDSTAAFDAAVLHDYCLSTAQHHISRRPWSYFNMFHLPCNYQIQNI